MATSISHLIASYLRLTANNIDAAEGLYDSKSLAGAMRVWADLLSPTTGRDHGSDHEGVSFRHVFQTCYTSPDESKVVEDAVREALADAISIEDIEFFPRLIPRGVTTCVIERDGKEVSRGYAFCSPLDQFSRRIGRAVSRSRAEARIQRLNSEQDLK